MTEGRKAVIIVGEDKTNVAINMAERLKGLSYQEVALWCERMLREEETVIAVNEVVKAWPLDGAFALAKAARAVFGWIETRNAIKQTFLGPMKVPPVEVSVEVSYGEYISVPWGGLALPGVEGELQCGAGMHEGMPAFVVQGEIKKKSLPLVKQLMNVTRDIVQAESIYKGKALIVEPVRNPDSGEMTILLEPPKFFKANGLTKEDLILPEAQYRAVNMAVFSMIEDSEAIVADGLPTKRTTVLDGQPGTGKTLTMSIAAGLCQKHGRTFILLKDINFLEDAISMADRYNFGPTLISAEDIDRRMSERDDTANNLLNAIDGVDSKKLDIQFLLTTNHKDQLIETFQRAGRSDMIITLPVPDAPAAALLLERYSTADFKVEKGEYEAIGELLAKAETLPANIAEVARRARYYRIAERADVIDGDMLMNVALQVVAEKKMEKKEKVVKEGKIERIAKLMEALANHCDLEVK